MFLQLRTIMFISLQLKAIIINTMFANLQDKKLWIN